MSEHWRDTSAPRCTDRIWMSSTMGILLNLMGLQLIDGQHMDGHSFRRKVVLPTDVIGIYRAKKDDAEVRRKK